MFCPDGQIAVEIMDTAVIKHYFFCRTFKKKIIPGFNRFKIIGTALIVSGLLVLLPSCEKNSHAEEVGVEIDNVSENIDERIRLESDRLINDRPDEIIEEEPDEAAKYAGGMV